MSNSVTISAIIVSWLETHPEVYCHFPGVSSQALEGVFITLRERGWYIYCDKDEQAVSKSPDFGKLEPTLHEFQASPHVAITGTLLISPDTKTVDDLWQEMRGAQVKAIYGALDKKLAEIIFRDSLRKFNLGEINIHVDGSKDIEISESLYEV